MRHAAFLAGAILAMSFGAAAPALAQTPIDFLAALFGGLARPRPVAPIPIMPGLVPGPSEPEAPRSSGRSNAYCVRMCDGRYFPLSNLSETGAQAQCAALCPRAETRVFRGGSSIDSASSATGLPYSAIQNAYLYRTRLDDACTCTGNGPLGLASIPITEDETLRRGDVVMTPEGLRVFDSKSSLPPHAESDFVPVDQAPRLSKELRQRMEDLQIATGGAGRL